jgi:hypothetical protein
MARVYLSRDGQVRGYSLGLAGFLIFRVFVFLVIICWPFGFIPAGWVWAVTLPWWVLLTATATGAYLTRRTARRR